MEAMFCPFITELAQDQKQYFKVIFLFVTYCINLTPYLWKVPEAKYSRANILRHVNRSTIRAKEDFLIQSIGREVNPHRTIFLLKEDSFLHAFQHFFLP